MKILVKLIIIMLILSSIVPSSVLGAPIVCTFTPNLGGTPTISDEYPSNTTSNIEFTPQLSVICNDQDGNTMTVNWSSNSSGEWVVFGYNVTTNGTIYQTNANFSNESTRYYWRVNASDGTNYIVEEYYFTTLADLPQFNITFAGNPYGYGGPLYLPPYDLADDVKPLADEGYYTNASHQSVTFMNVTVNVTDESSDVSEVWLHLLNETTWENATPNNTGYQMIFYNNNWTYNVTELGNYNYSFDIWANDTRNNSNTTSWEKRVGPDEFTYYRRYVSFGYAPETFNYTNENTNFYLFAERYTTSRPWADGLHHDQGTDHGDGKDTGYLLQTLPGEDIENISCAGYVGALVDETLTINQTDVFNVYQHTWWNGSGISYNDELLFGYNSTKRDLITTLDNPEQTSYGTNAVSNVSVYLEDLYPVDNGTYNMHLTSRLYNSSTEFNVTSNSIYQLMLMWETYNLIVVSNRSLLSWFIINVPDNTTLQDLDSDSDGLNDYEELYVTFTHPFLDDTDYDGVSDYSENNSGSDPNNYTDTSEPVYGSATFSNPYPENNSWTNYNDSDINITVSNPLGEEMDVYFYWFNNGSLIGSDLSVTNNTVANITVPFNYEFYQQYYWNITVVSSSYNNQSGNWTIQAESEHPDIDRDYKCYPSDLSILVGNYMTEGGAPRWIRSDLNFDGAINPQDLSILVGHYMEEF